MSNSHRVLIDIGHPAHVHFFKEPIAMLKQRGWEVLVASRDKDCAVALLDSLDVPHYQLSGLGSGLLGLGWELLQRNAALWRLVRREKPDVMAAIGGIFIAQVGVLARVPSLVFYDTENARLQNALTYPFATKVIVPRCYQGKTPRRRTERYAGYHELSYLHPDYFVADRERALAAGLAAEGPTYFLRLVSWQANHDIGEHGWSPALLAKVVARLQARGKVLISAEGDLPVEFASLRYAGPVADVHHVMAFCAGFVGESATMASECVVLGVPSVYLAETTRGYMREQEQRYGLLFEGNHLDEDTLQTAVDWLLAQKPEQSARKRQRLLDDTIDVAEYVLQQILRQVAPAVTD